MSTESSSSDVLLKEILEGLKSLRQEPSQLASSVDAINGRVNMLAEIKQIKDEAKEQPSNGLNNLVEKAKGAVVAVSEQTVEAVSKQYEEPPSAADVSARRSSVSKTSKIILTSYPGQAGVDPLPMDWGHKDPAVRGPVVVSRHSNTIRRRNGMFLSAYDHLALLKQESNRRSRWFVLNLPRPCCSEWQSRH